MTYSAASRSELAEVENREAEVLSTFLPPLLTESEMDNILNDIIAGNSAISGDPKKAVGLCIKTFYTKVDRSRVDGKLLQQRAMSLLSK